MRQVFERFIEGARHGDFGAWFDSLDKARTLRFAWKAHFPRDTARAMSQENVEIVRRFFEAFENDNDDAFQDTLHPEIEWRPFEEQHNPSYGREGARRIRQQWLDTWDEHHIDLERTIGEGENVVATVHVTARGKGSGVEVDVHLHGHFKVRDGRIAYLFEYEDRSEALEAAGLPE